MISVIVAAAISLGRNGITVGQMPGGQERSTREYCYERPDGRGNTIVTLTVTEGSDVLVRLNEGDDVLGKDSFSVASTDHPATIVSTGSELALSLEALRGGSRYAIEVTDVAANEITSDVRPLLRQDPHPGLTEICAAAVEVIRSASGTLGGRSPFDTRCYTFVVPFEHEGLLTVSRDGGRMEVDVCNKNGTVIRGSRSLQDVTSVMRFEPGRHFVRLTSADHAAAAFTFNLNMRKLRRAPDRAAARLIHTSETLMIESGGSDGSRWEWLYFTVDEPSEMVLRLTTTSGDAANVSIYRDGLLVGEQQVRGRRTDLRRHVSRGTYYVRVAPSTARRVAVSLRLLLTRARKPTHSARPK
jgi:hypothetical protein